MSCASPWLCSSASVSLVKWICQVIAKEEREGASMHGSHYGYMPGDMPVWWWKKHNPERESIRSTAATHVT